MCASESVCGLDPAAEAAETNPPIIHHTVWRGKLDIATAAAGEETRTKTAARGSTCAH